MAPRPIRRLVQLGVGVYLLMLFYARFDAAEPAQDGDVTALPLVSACMNCMNSSNRFGFLVGRVKWGPPAATVAAIRQ